MSVRDYNKRIQTQLRERLRLVAELIRDQVIMNVTLTDHTLQELRQLGHPYSRQSPQTLHSPSFLVHTHTGDLRDAVTMEETPKGYRVGVDDAKAPHAVHVLFGTSRMVARDFITGSISQVRQQIKSILHRESPLAR